MPIGVVKGKPSAEVRAEFARAGRPWPKCACHNENMYWRGDPKMTEGGHFRCAVDIRKSMQKTRTNRREAGKCYDCDKPALPNMTRCEICTERRRDVMAKWNTSAHGTYYRAKWRLRDQRRRRREETTVTGVLSGEV